MDNSQKDILDHIGKFIGYKQMLLFTILLLYSCHFTYNAHSCPFLVVHKLCIVFTIIVLILISSMFILAFILALGISMREADCLRPWLIMSAAMLVLGVAFITISSDFLLITLGALVLFLQGISWYPVYRLYHRFCSETIIRTQNGQNVEESNPLTSNGQSEATTPYRDNVARVSRKTYSEAPPSYETVMGLDTNPPCFDDKSILVWNKNLNSKAVIQ